MGTPAWHLLDVGSIWMKEFASALGQFTTTVNWMPEMKGFEIFASPEQVLQHRDPALTIRRFPLQRGYSQYPISLLVDLGRTQTRRMLRFAKDPKLTPLICTTPYYAPVAEQWSGPVIYYQTDLTYGYHGLKPAQVLSLDQRMCRAATAVCPNSQRIAHYMTSKAHCDPGKIVVVPNATRRENVLEKAPHGPGPLPDDVKDLPRPILGVIGNLAANLDWVLLEQAVQKTADCTWLFVGPYNMEVQDREHRDARTRVLLMQQDGRVRFTGAKSYGDLQGYARAVDAAVLPYRRKEPTFSGSSTRFYEHLAACRPMLATPGFEELRHKKPLLELVENADDLAHKVRQLQEVHFEDGRESLRWEASIGGTWSMRAATVMRAVKARWPADLETSASIPEVEHLIEQGRPHGYTSEFELVVPN
jgi:glycosyltransferase involved in cell wall biosynthesis